MKRNPYSRRARYRHRRVRASGKMDPRSIRTVRSGRARIVVGCPKGKYSAKRKRCRVGMRATSVLTRKRRSRRNPTLVHQGLAARPTFHLLDHAGRAVADLYGVNLERAKRVAQTIADATGFPVEIKPFSGSQFEAARHARSAASARPRLRNPGTSGTLERAEGTFKMWHGFSASQVTRLSGNRKIPHVLVALGRVPEIVYESDKWKGKLETYVHKTGKPKPILATGPDGKGLYLVGGRVKVTADGLVG